ncbi:MAG: hypothetical protein ACTHX2_15590 [Microbacterium sp.]
MSRLRTLAFALAALALGALVGIIMSNIWLGLTISVIIAIVLLISGQSKRGGNQGVNDDDHGIEL